MPKPVVEIAAFAQVLQAWSDELRDQYNDLDAIEEEHRSDADEEQMLELDTKCDEINSIIDQIEDL